MTKPDLVLGIDIGGTKMAAGLVNPDGEVMASGRTPTPARSSAEEMWSALTDLISDALESAGKPRLIGVGVGCAGPMVWPDGVVSPLNISAWRGF
ncbi:MAG: ROK family protein, partial [Candidatus Nanopelagicales bacterium]|nr:ROK family protein [Candidatus Nanopelagicales bacterium]